MDVVLITVCMALAIWSGAALVFAPALVGFAPVVLLLLLLLPLLFLVFPLWLVSWISYIIEKAVSVLGQNTENIKRKPSSEDLPSLAEDDDVEQISSEQASSLGDNNKEPPSSSGKKRTMALLMDQPKLLLKVGLMQAFTTLICMGWFGRVYYGQQSWMSAVSERSMMLPPAL